MGAVTSVSSALIFVVFFAGDLLGDAGWHNDTSLTGLDTATFVMLLSGEDFAEAVLAYGFGMHIVCWSWSWVHQY